MIEPTSKNTELATLTEAELNNVLRNSLYPGASDMSLELVKGYCKASGLDIMLKPVHIVPMWNASIGKMVDVVMPGIGLYRTTASRTKQYAGIDEPDFGPAVTKTIGGVECTYPEWCKVTVKRNFGGSVGEFTAKEYWLENYAVKGGKERSTAPNAMWAKRPYGQLAKCSESQALRKAFPEVGSQPTAEEMEGKALDEEKIINPLPGQPAPPTLDQMLAKVKAMPEEELTPDRLASLDLKPYGKDEILAIKGAVTARRRELKANSVVADIKPEPPEVKGSSILSKAMKDSKAKEQLTAEYNSMSDDDKQKFNTDLSKLIVDSKAMEDSTNWSELIENAQSQEELTAIYNSMTDDDKQKHNDQVDEQMEFLRSVG